MCFIEDDEVVSVSLRIFEVVKHAFPGQGVDTDDCPVAVCSQEGITGSRVCAADDTEWQVKQGTHFSLPVANQAGWWDDEYATDESARQHFAYVQARHDCLTGTCVVSQQESQRGLLQHLLVHGDALMREWVN